MERLLRVHVGDRVLTRDQVIALDQRLMDSGDRDGDDGDDDAA